MNEEFFTRIQTAMAGMEVEAHGSGAIRGFLQMARGTGARLIFIGNGGSAAIASHMAADYQKNGGFTTLCFNDPAMLTCVANDMGYESVFRAQLEKHGRWGDILFAISSSGDSMSIFNAINLCPKLRINTVTLTGFLAENRIRGLGGVNYYIPSVNYGVVEVCHLIILHGLLNEVMDNERSITASPPRSGEIRLGHPE